MTKLLLIGIRACRVLFLLLSASVDFIFRLWLPGKTSSIQARAEWMQPWAVRFLHALGVNVQYRGKPPARGILVANHLSYIDVLVLGSIRPLVFLSKSEVRSWPLIGLLTRFAGTLFIKREQKSDVVRLGGEMAPVVEAGMVVVLFLEGTSSDGQTVLPFRSSLLAPAAEHGWPATGAWLHYELPGGSAADDVCYWGDMNFGSHVLNLLSKNGIQAFVSFGSPVSDGLDRKEMARALHAQVCGLKDEYLAGTQVREGSASS
ncbi:MAG TPA: lysophospholipid acyltransferase family protein [Verrucomicrobiae bacterium]|nr:lysophospholipid acyltransferase family protein [Verrucomicrobiae bacterium]